MIPALVRGPDFFDPVEVVSRAAAGDEDAFASLVTEYGQTVKRVILAIVRQSEDAKDITQEVWIEVSRSLPRLREPSRFLSWVLRIARNASLDFTRSRGRHPVVGDEEMPDIADPAEDGPERQIISLDERRKVWEALGALSHRDRTALVLRESQGLSNAEIAESLSLRRNTAEVLLFRARQRFRQHYIRSDERLLTCSVSPLHLSAFIDGELEGQACWDLEAHLQCCSGCRDWLATMESGRKLFRGVGLFAVPGPVTAPFHTKILASAGEASVATSVPLAAAGGDGATAVASGSAVVAGSVVAATAGGAAATGAGSTVVGAMLTRVAGKVVAAMLSVSTVTAVAVQEDAVSPQAIVPSPVQSVVEHPSVLHRVGSTPVEEAGPDSKDQVTSSGDRGSHAVGPSVANAPARVGAGRSAQPKKDSPVNQHGKPDRRRRL